MSSLPFTITLQQFEAAVFSGATRNPNLYCKRSRLDYPEAILAVTADYRHELFMQYLLHRLELNSTDCRSPNTEFPEPINSIDDTHAMHLQ